MESGRRAMSIRPLRSAPPSRSTMHPFGWAGTRIESKTSGRAQTSSHIGGNSTIQNNALSTLDMAAWGHQGKTRGDAGLGSARARFAMPYRSTPTRTAAIASRFWRVRKYFGDGYRHVRAQMGGYGDGGVIPAGRGSRPESGFAGPAFRRGRVQRGDPQTLKY